MSFCAAGKKSRDAPARRALSDALLRERREWVAGSGDGKASRATALRHACTSRDVRRRHTGRVRDVHDTL